MPTVCATTTIGPELNGVWPEAHTQLLLLLLLLYKYHLCKLASARCCCFLSKKEIAHRRGIVYIYSRAVDIILLLSRDAKLCTLIAISVDFCVFFFWHSYNIVCISIIICCTFTYLQSKYYYASPQRHLSCFRLFEHSSCRLIFRHFNRLYYSF